MTARYDVKEPICSSPKDLECVKKVNVDTSTCLKPCSGLIVTSFSKKSVTKSVEKLFPILKDYNKFKIITEYPPGETGKDNNNNCFV